MLSFLETAIFTREITSLLSDDEYAELQGVLIVHPAAGDVIRGTAGLRKLRWKHRSRGKGTRGGIRVIYYWYATGSVIYMLYAYSKDEQGDLTPAQVKLLMRLVAEELQ